jgi:hypothetical protein
MKCERASEQASEPIKLAAVVVNSNPLELIAITAATLVVSTGKY